MVFDLLSGRREWIDSTRPGGSSWYAPLHQAAWYWASIAVAEQLIRLGAWRTHRNTRGERSDVARRRGHWLATIALAGGIIDFRNMLIHRSANVVPERVWDYAEDHVPQLLRIVQSLLAELGPPEE